MKTIKIVTLLALVVSILTSSYAQSEYDDMYYTGKNRKKKKVKKEEVYAYNSEY